MTRKTVTIDGVEYAFTYAYDDAGNLTRIEHPDGYAVNYSYHNNSNLIATVWADGPYVEVDISDYNNFGKPGRIAYPAFDTLIDYYPRTGRVKGIDVPGLMSLDYQYSDAGNVLSIHDAVRNFAYTYTYDNLHRLKTESASGPFRLAESRDIRLYYEGTETHAVSRVVTHRGERNLIYEDNGNMTIGYDFSRPGGFPERRIDYNAENMPLSIDYEPEGGPVSTVNLTYDGDGRRVKKQAGADTVIYVDNTYEIRNGQPVKYIFAGNMRVAKVTGGMVHYYHKDHLGSSAIVTDTSGAMMESLVYEAYGRPRPTCAPNSGDMAYTYTDQEWDGETGLYNYDARLYDPVLGRFISADIMVGNWHDPQQLDRYAYVRNNPLKFTDPTGHYILGLPSDRSIQRANFRSIRYSASARQGSALHTVSAIGFGVTAIGGAMETAAGIAAVDALTVASVVTEIGAMASRKVKAISKIAGAIGDAVGLRKAPKRIIHKNSLAYEGETHVYRIKNPDGKTYKIGESAQGTRVRDGASIRAEQQVRKLNREVGPGHSREIRETFPNKANARDYETRVIERYRRLHGQDTLPGNKTNR